MDRLFGPNKHGWRLFVTIVALAAGIAGLLGYRFYIGGQRIDRNATALTALCALRLDLENRIKGQRQSILNGVVFLHRHPSGAFGFSKGEIRASISAQRRSYENSIRTRKALNSLDCGK